MIPEHAVQPYKIDRKHNALRIEKYYNACKEARDFAVSPFCIRPFLTESCRRMADMSAPRKYILCIGTEKDR